ncbi:MAG: sugar nucleotide-binding protein, partial [Candidatus Moraniibacteriota bacterium]
MRTVLILGSKGMLGQELVRTFSMTRRRSDELWRGEAGGEITYQVIAWDREEIDATDSVVLREKILEIQPNLILNAIAYNAVDLCETSDEEWTKAKQLNIDLPRNLAMIARELDATLIHYSTDYVFGGEENREKPYTEMDILAPVQRYGQTKFVGEQASLTVGGKVYVVRLSKLFGRAASSVGGKKSFFGMML